MSKSYQRRAILGTILVVVLAGALGVPEAYAQSKIGWVDLDRILAEYDEFREAEALFQEDAAVWEADFDSVQEVYFQRLEEYQRQRLLLSDDTRREREQELATMEREVFEVKARLESEAERRKAELTTPILEKIQEVVEQVATDEDYDFILNASQIYMTPQGLQFSPIMYAKKKLDLTDRIFEELQRLK
ncbi:MAG TPA: OmpH family outer membrane protein [Acidobacteriota bacterium]|nr:OmpH family outer membrane protein [Acidobacteriota bacterium]